MNKGINEFDKKFATNKSSKITLINNDIKDFIKDFMKVINSLGNI